ncbi:MAG: transporter related protein [Subtercola sp.]|nr:transporter related protein [Subtercola sp.]
MTEVALSLTDVTKTYGATTALHKVSISVTKGAIHGLVGENGAGKSTLGKIVGGIVRPDSGIVEVHGRQARYGSPRDAILDGIAVMGQEIALVPAMSVLENVFLGAEKRFDRGSSNARSREELYRELTERVGFRPSSSARVDSLSISEQQRVQILRALARGAKILIMDEPTSSQHREELRKLHQVFSELRDDGMTIIYVSHFLDDVISLADDITILRGGQLVGNVKAKDTNPDLLLSSMLGQRLESVFPDRNRGGKRDAKALEVRNLSQGATLNDVSIDVRRGEIVGLSGLVGSGRTELARAIFGVDTYDAGTVEINGVSLRRRSSGAAMRAGVALVPEDRITQGLLQNLSQEANIALPHLAAFSTAGVVRGKAIKAKALVSAAESGVNPLRLSNKPDTLSGGNQQKVLLAKWLLGDPKVLILDEPTRGVDVGAKSSIYHLIAKLADEKGMAVLLISSELEEIVELSDRVYVLHGGGIAAEFEGAEINGESIMRAAFGYSESKGVVGNVA